MGTRRILAALIVLGLTSAVNGAVFAKYDGVDGESKDADHDKWIDVLSIDWGMVNPVSPSGPDGGRNSAGVTFEDLAMTKYIDKSTPALMTACAMGTPFRIIELNFTRTGTGGERQTYLKITMQDVIITSISTGGSGGEDRLTENVTLNFAKIKVEYATTPDGEPAGVDPFTWDVAQNTP